MSDQVNSSTNNLSKEISDNKRKNMVENQATRISNPALTAEQLKTKFEAGDSPLEQDFADLIDIANYTQAVFNNGSSENPNIGNGFKFNEYDEVVINAKLPIKVTSTGVALSSSAPFELKDGALSLGVSVGLFIRDGKLSVKTGDGVGVWSEGVGIAPDYNRGMNFDGHGLTLTQQVVPEKVLAFWPGELPLPEGWVYCDGKNGAPFVLGHILANTNGPISSEFIKATQGGEGEMYKLYAMSLIMKV